MTYDQFLEKLRSKQNFSFSRWGDGEFNCMLQARPGKTNCDGNYYYPDLGEALRKIIDSAPPYYMGMQSLAKEIFPDEATKFMLNGSEWIEADILHRASQAEGLDRLWGAIKDRAMMIVGPQYLNLICKYPSWLVDTGEKNCWEQKRELMQWIDMILEVREGIVVFICAGMAANYFVDELYKKYGTQHTFIDAGSVFDPYCGRNTRKYHSQIIERLNANQGSNIES